MKLKIFTALFLFLNLTGCSLTFGLKNSFPKKYDELNHEIIENFSRAISRDPNNFFFYLERGKAKHENGDFKGAIKDFNYSFKINPDLRAIFHKANSKYKYGDFEGAIKDYENLSVFEEYKDQIFYNIASAQLINLDLQDSINNFTKSIEYDDNDEYAYLYRGNGKFKLEDYEGSLKDYGKSLEINNKSYIVLNNKGVSNFMLKNYKDALQDFKKSLKFNPRNYGTLYNKSLTHFELKEIKKACIDLKKSIKLGKEVFKEEYLKICP